MKNSTVVRHVRASLDHLAHATPLSPDLDEVRARAYAAPTGAVSRRRPARLAAAAAVVVLAVGIVAVQGLIGSDGRAFAVRPLEDGRLQIDLLDAAAIEAEEVADALRQFGVEVSFTPLVAPDDRAGQILGFSGSHVNGPGGEWPPAGIAFEDDGGDSGADVMLIDPSVFRGTLDVQVGIPAVEGQAYEYVQDAFLPEGPLAGVDCESGVPLTAQSLLPYLEQRDLTATWWVVADPARDPQGGYTFRHDPYLAGVPEGEVVLAEALDADTISIGVLPATIDAPFVETHLDMFPCDNSRPQQADTYLGD